MAYVLFIIPLGFFLLVLQFIRNAIVGLRELSGALPPVPPSPQTIEETFEGGEF
jgi:TRAP-type C4-dicarboxylate transport system permease small subunit